MASARAEQLAAVGRLAAGVAHEIRNPLASVKMLAQAGLLDGDGLSREDLTIIEAEVRRAEKSLQNLLDYARPPQPDRRPLDLTELSRAVLDLIRGRAARQEVELALNAAGPLEVVADAEQARQAVLNLCWNALDAMPQGGTLTVTPRRAGHRAEVEVADTGPGVAPDFAPHLFEPFASTKEAGLGLGLSICKRVAEAHGGTISAGNRAGGGASFFLSLALEADRADPVGG